MRGSGMYGGNDTMPREQVHRGARTENGRTHP
jgi:hypothetical protein